MATHKVKSGQTDVEWADKVVIRGDSSSEELTYNQVYTMLEDATRWEGIIAENIKSLEDKLAKITAVVDK